MVLCPNVSSPGATTVANATTLLKRAYFGMQCFWGAESTFSKVAGVRRTRVGYAGGNLINPTYQNIGDHTEITELIYDESLCSFSDLIRYFFLNHDATKSHKQQYESVILYVDDEQRKAAECVIVEEQKKHNEKNDGKHVTTKLKRLDTFYQAENYHQKYWLRCQHRIFNQLKLTDAEVVDTTLATKLNAYLAGYEDNFVELKHLAAEHNLSDSLIDVVESIARSGGDPRVCH